MQTELLKPSEIVNLIPSIDSIQKVHNYLTRNNIETIKDNSRTRIPQSSVRKILEDKGFSFKPKNFCFHIVKGGVGKTTFASTFAYRASQYGARVLAIDLDQQGNLSTSLGVNSRGIPVMIDIIKGKVGVTEAIVPINENLFIIPSNMSNSKLDQEIDPSRFNISSLFTDMLEPIRNDIDYVVFDCPPSLNKITTSATLASDLVVMPLNADVYSMDALDQTVGEIDSISKSYKKNINYTFVWNKFDQREKLCLQYLRDLQVDPRHSANVSLSLVRVDTNIKNALHNETPLFSLDMKSTSKEDFDNLTKELMGIKDWQFNITETNKTKL